MHPGFWLLLLTLEIKLSFKGPYLEIVLVGIQYESYERWGQNPPSWPCSSLFHSLGGSSAGSRLFPSQSSLCPAAVPGTGAVVLDADFRLFPFSRFSFLDVGGGGQVRGFARKLYMTSSHTP